MAHTISLHRYFATVATTWLTQYRYTGISLRLPQHGSHSMYVTQHLPKHHNLISLHRIFATTVTTTWLAQYVCYWNTYVSITLASYWAWGLITIISLATQQYGWHSVYGSGYRYGYASRYGCGSRYGYGSGCCYDYWLNARIAEGNIYIQSGSGCLHSLWLIGRKKKIQICSRGVGNCTPYDCLVQ